MKFRIQISAVMLVLLTSGLQNATAQEEATPTITWPNTRAGQMAAAFVEAFQAEDEDVMRRFMQEKRDEASLQRIPLDQRMVQFRQMREQLGTLEVASVTADGDFKAEVIAKSSRMGMWLSMSFGLQETEPYKLAHFGMRPSAPPKEGAAKARFAEWENLQELASMACKEAEMPAIVMAVIQDGQIVERAVAGVREVGGQDAAQLEDCFQMGSIGKAMTATLIGKLIDAEALRWDMTIEEVLPDIAMRDEYRSVTLEQLLQHRGALRPYADEGIDSFPELSRSGRSTTEERALFAHQVLNDEPLGKAGTFNYSNAGYVIAALMAERATEKPYEQLMQSLLFKQLKMQSAHFGWPASAQRADQPRGHFGDPPDLRVQGYDEEPWQAYMFPAGGVSCSIEDLGRFALLHLQGMNGQAGPLRAETLVQLHQPMVSDDAPTNYASGWVVEKSSSGEPKHWHSGSAGTFYATLSLYPERDLAIAIAINCAGTSAAIVEELEKVVYTRWTQNPRADR